MFVAKIRLCQMALLLDPKFELYFSDLNITHDCEDIPVTCKGLSANDTIDIMAFSDIGLFWCACDDAFTLQQRIMVFGSNGPISLSVIH